MRVLVVLSQPPRTEGGAASRCSVALLRGLREQGVEVTAVAAGASEAAAEVPADLQVEVFGPDYDFRLMSRVRRYTSPRAEVVTGRFADRIRAIAATVDVVHFDELDASAGGLRLGLDVPSVAHLHCDARRDQALALLPSASVREALILRLGERWVRRHADRLLANTAELARDFQADARQPVAVSPLALDPADYRQRASLDAPVAGLIGAASWPPTASAVRRLVTDVWPLVVARRPGAQLRLAGRGMVHETFADLPDVAGISWVGEVDVAEEFLGGLGVLLYPLIRGSGTKVKVLEALALGLPVVTTPDGAEGIARAPGIEVHREPADLAAATVALLDDLDIRRSAGAAARIIFEAGHTPRHAAAALVGVYEQLLTSSPAG